MERPASEATGSSERENKNGLPSRCHPMMIDRSRLCRIGHGGWVGRRSIPAPRRRRRKKLPADAWPGAPIVISSTFRAPNCHWNC
jgi:hypothetical protein